MDKIGKFIVVSYCPRCGGPILIDEETAQLAAEQVSIRYSCDCREKMGAGPVMGRAQWMNTPPRIGG